ncbi:hypothetical protein [Hirschia litorea]|uniref:Rod shape-determining protein MreD n=1 Tax=Hirschia litorea TaxID=1199156 RepID=A0ABW2ILG4_9PROT
MSGAERIRVFLGALLAIFICLLGTTPLLHHMPFPLTDTWPIAVFLFALSCARLSMSIWAAVLIVMVGLVQDFVLEAPLGAWSFAGLCAYAAGLIAKDSFKAMAATIPSQLVLLVAGSIVGIFALSIAGDIAGGADVLDAPLWSDLVLTAGLYYLVTPLFAPYKGGLSS